MAGRGAAPPPPDAINAAYRWGSSSGTYFKAVVNWIATDPITYTTEWHSTVPNNTIRYSVDGVSWGADPLPSGYTLLYGYDPSYGIGTEPGGITVASGGHTATAPYASVVRQDPPVSNYPDTPALP